MHACGCARNRRQETNVLIVSVLFAVVVNLALRSKAQGRIEVVGMCKLTIVVGLGAFPVTIMGDPEIEDEVPRLALFTPKQEGCPEETGNTKKSSFPHTPDAAARTPVRLKVCAGARGGGHYPPENSRTGVDCSLSRVAPPPTTVQSLTPTTRASHQ